MNQTANQLRFHEFGGPEQLRLDAVDLPAPAAGEVLVRVEAAGLNYADILRRKNEFFLPTPLPHAVGTEAVGVITASGEDRAGLRVGDRVLAILPGGGACADYALAPAQYCVPLPPHIDSRAATAIFVQGSTAHLIVHEVLPPDLAGKSILVHAAAGGVGSLLVQLARLKGAYVIAAASTPEKLKAAADLGADGGVCYADSNWPRLALAANQGRKFDYILEASGGEICARSFGILEDGGSLVVYGASSRTPAQLLSEAFVDHNHNLLAFNLNHFIQKRTGDWQRSLGEVIALLAEGKLKVVVNHAFPLAEAAEAQRMLEARQTVGKVVLIP
jgi:NADPH2:quinone reductase